MNSRKMILLVLQIVGTGAFLAGIVWASVTANGDWQTRMFWPLVLGYVFIAIIVGVRSWAEDTPPQNDGRHVEHPAPGR